jgi:hypothetical protein
MIAAETDLVRWLAPLPTVARRHLNQSLLVPGIDPDFDVDPAPVREPSNTATKPPCAPNPIPLLDFSGPPRPCDRFNVADAPWAFFPIGDAGFRLHPNHGGAAPVRLRVLHQLAPPRRFTATVRVAHTQTRPVRFRLTIDLITSPLVPSAPPSVNADIVVDPGQSVPWQIDLPLMSGPAFVELATEMADPTDSNGHAWAAIIDPRLD